VYPVAPSGRAELYAYAVPTDRQEPPTYAVTSTRPPPPILRPTPLYPVATLSSDARLYVWMAAPPSAAPPDPKRPPDWPWNGATPPEQLAAVRPPAVRDPAPSERGQLQQATRDGRGPGPTADDFR